MAQEITLTVGGERAAVTMEEAQEFKDRCEDALTNDNATVTKLDLSCRQWSPETVNHMLPTLQKLSPNLRVIDISDTIAGLETSIGFEVMEGFTQAFSANASLEDVNMADNACGPRVLTRIASILDALNLKHINFSNCGMSAETIPQLDDALRVNGEGPGLARLETLILDRNMIGPEGSESMKAILATCQSMQHFSYCGCRPSSIGSEHIGEGIKNMAENHNPHPLRRIDLEDCDFVMRDSNQPLIYLCEGVKKFAELRHIDISEGGDIGEEGAGMIGQALIDSKCPIEHINLSGSSLGVDGATALQDMLKDKLGSLKVLKLADNELTNDGVKEILAPFENGVANVLETLVLDGNYIGDGAIDTLLAAHLPNLRLLSLKENMDLEEVDNERKKELRRHFTNNNNAKVVINEEEEDAEANQDVQEENSDDDVDAITSKLGQM